MLTQRLTVPTRLFGVIFKMKILAIADRPTKRKISEIISEGHFDLIITLGDLEQSQIQEMESITGIPKIGVYGNHDYGDYLDQLGIKNMHLTTFEHEGLVFGGFEGSVRYKNDIYAKMYTQEEAIDLIKEFPKVDVMIAHCPPYGINDEPDELAHQGFKALREYIEKQKPKYFLHGHTYPKDTELVTRYKDTEIVYVYADKVIKLDL